MDKKPDPPRCKACGAFKQRNPKTGRYFCPATEAHKVLRGK